MKLLSKQISSPSRTEKFPPPLLKFLRSNGGNKSRGRSTRSSPMFIIRKKTDIETTQEPSSPKVTCMGQVRVKRSSNKSVSTKPKHRKTLLPWFKKSLFCDCFDGKQNPRRSEPFWWRKFGFRQMGCKGKVGMIDGLSRREPKDEEMVVVDDDVDDGGGEECKSIVSSCSFPPKNALLLMRCSSAPYRASSLATRLWETGEDHETQQKYRNPETPTLKIDPICKDLVLDLEMEEKSGFCQGFESSSSRKVAESRDIEEEILRPVLPLILTRCKSEPGRRSEKIDDLETCFFQKRLGFVGILPHLHD